MIDRSSRPELFCKNGVLRNFAKFTGKHLRQSIFSLQASTIKKETLTQVFSCELCEISKNTFCYRTPPVAASKNSHPQLERNSWKQILHSILGIKNAKTILISFYKRSVQLATQQQSRIYLPNCKCCEIDFLDMQSLVINSGPP